jgi:hypothetical protein
LPVSLTIQKAINTLSELIDYHKTTPDKYGITESDVILVLGSSNTPSNMDSDPAILVPLGFYSKDQSINTVKNCIPYVEPKVW